MVRCDQCSRIIDTDDCPESCTDDGYLCEYCAADSHAAQVADAANDQAWLDARHPEWTP